MMWVLGGLVLYFLIRCLVANTVNKTEQWMNSTLELIIFWPYFIYLMLKS